MRETTLSEFLKGRGYTNIQMEKNAVGHFEVQALVNDRPVRLLVDTGASHTVIARASVSKLNLAITESETKAGGIGTSEHAVAYGVVETLELESFHISSLPVGVIDLSHVNQALEAHGGRKIDGAIGGDLMGSRAAVIDYQHAILYLKMIDLLGRAAYQLRQTGCSFQSFPCVSMMVVPAPLAVMMAAIPSVASTTLRLC